MLKRVQVLKTQIENDRKVRIESEAHLKNQITEKDTIIEELRNQVTFLCLIANKFFHIFLKIYLLN